ncbi:MAG: SGNH/GDSL hydrolase family protein, partial [Clostridia bacterium]|nr:SGNH/GDSL hydrolase family protein [Clostridia bacterium]
MIFQELDRIVFAGDSVTDMGSQNPVGEGLFDNVGRSYVRVIENMLAAYYPEVRVRVTNSGISGNTSRDLLARYERDVVELDPDWVSICIGINDVWRQFDSPAIPSACVLPDEYRENVEKMILAVKDKVKGVFLLTPYYMEPNREDMMRARMDEYAAICRELAERHGCRLVDFQSMY